MGYNPWGHKDSDVTKGLTLLFALSLLSVFSCRNLKVGDLHKVVCPEADLVTIFFWREVIPETLLGRCKQDREANKRCTF